MISNEVIPSILKYTIISLLDMSSNESIDWNQVVKKEVRGIRDNDLGEVQKVHQENIITKVGLIDRVTYSIPKNLVDKFDGHTLRFKLTRGEAEAQFKIKDEVWL